MAGDDDDELVTFNSHDELEELICNLLAAVDVKRHNEQQVSQLTEQIVKLETEMKKIALNTRKLEEHLDASRVKLNKNLKPEYEPCTVSTIDIDSRGNVKVVVHETDPTPTNDSSSRRQSASTSSQGTSSNNEVDPMAGKNIKEESGLYLTRTPTIIPRVMPKMGDKVFAMKYSALHFWLPGIVAGTRTSIYNDLEFRVEFEPHRKGQPLPTALPMNTKDNYTKKFLGPKHIAYNLPCPFVLPVGTRVIARFAPEVRSPPNAGEYYAGIIAEPPKNTNKFRYLIFFDDGYAHYVGQFDVLLVCETSAEIWRDIHPDSQDFIRNYLQKYPERPMLRLEKGSMVSLEWNGRWFTTRVLEIDGSLAKMQFEVDKRCEWVYRGSLRLYPMFNKRARSLLHQHSAGGTVASVPRRNAGKFAIEYPDDAVIAEINKNEPHAKKSTALPPPPPAPKPVPVGNFATANTQNLPNTRPPTAASMSCLEEFEGKLVRTKVPKDRPRPKVYVPHTCGPTCVISVNTGLAELGTVNALLYPIWFGWNREVTLLPKRYIFYRTPCGLRLRDYEELQEYLNLTKLNLGIDFFCFDLNVDIQLHFVTHKQMYIIKDLSYGKEVVQVQCINSIDHDYPDFVQYTTDRLPVKNVKINLDDNFLACCDCTDDCLDKEKCACWQLTLEGAKLGALKGAFHIEPGYQNRRLHDHLVTGIYECNKKCKCRSTCSNRVVQNPLKWQLQVFKTSTKGWAVRPLYDVPAGSFICVYVGQVLNDQVANEDGKNYGDEYLAELDYIEVVETYKEGYEADVVEPEEYSTSRASKNDDPDYMVVDDDDDDDYDPNRGKKKQGKRQEASDEEVATRRPQRFNPKIEPPIKQVRKKTRELFGDDETCYIMDAKTVGNIGRYLNHSCEPNVFVQNVFVDTHDLRFPWVCFFAYKHIRAGTELTWDYNYDVGSVPGKTLYCYCAAPECRGRLL